MIYLTYMEIKGECGEIVTSLDRSVFYGEYMDEIMRRGNAESVRESLSALLLLQKTLKAAGVSANGGELCRSENGRPYFRALENMDFSISHSKNAVACALTTDMGERVGVDVELVDRKSDKIKLARRFFSVKENEALENAYDYGRAWTRTWTRKEAYIKYLDGSPVRLSELDTEDADEVRFDSTFFTLDGDTEYCLTLCRGKRTDGKTVKITELV